MDIPFLTLARYDGQIIPITADAGDAALSERSLTWEAETDRPDWLEDAVGPFFTGRGDKLHDVYRLQYADINGLGNRMYRLEGGQESMFLKVLGDAGGNNRELLVWKMLGYGGEKQPFIRGLPPAKKVTVDHALRAILTPYFPGVMRAIGGGGYEFPLVLCLLLYLEETLRKLHQAGLAYMDLCPANILYQTAPSGALLFYLTDMGGVKPLADHPSTDLFEALKGEVTPRRWTRREVLPPGDMFPHHEADARLEPRAEYDLYTLARTGQLLLGLAGEGQASDLAGFTDQFSLENLLKPRRDEVRRLQGVLSPWLRGAVQDDAARDSVRAGLWDLFANYFLDRSAFAADYLDEPGHRERWRTALLSRLNRYRMADSRATADLEKQCEASWEKTSSGGFAAEIAHLEGLCEGLRDGARDRVLDALQTLASSRLLRQSQTANYAYFHHLKCLRALHGGSQTLRETLLKLARAVEPAMPMDEEPERATLQAVRREGQSAELGVLRRQLQLEPN